MKTNEIALRPIHYASVSGGKDSLYMMKIILENPQKYPLDMVVNFELEIEWPFVYDSVKAIRNMCDSLGIPFKSIRPRKSWDELYQKRGMPSRRVRWCNREYKLDCKAQLEEWIKGQSCRPVAYIGFCADEVKRFKYKVGTWNPEENQDVCYPLAEEGIVEDTILEWARTQPMFGDWYKVFKRQGCCFCPFLSTMEMAYMAKYFPDRWEKFIKCVEGHEQKYKRNWKTDYDVAELKRRAEGIWRKRLDFAEQWAGLEEFKFKFAEWARQEIPPDK